MIYGHNFKRLCKIYILMSRLCELFMDYVILLIRKFCMAFTFSNLLFLNKYCKSGNFRENLIFF